MTKKRYLTTGQIAELLEVDPRTISRWVDNGLLAGHRGPDCKERRVHRDDLETFLVEHGYTHALDEFETMMASTRILAIGVTHEFADQLGKLLEKSDARMVVCNQVIEAGAFWNRDKPDTVIIDFAIGTLDARTAARWLASQEPTPLLIGMVNEDMADVDVDRYQRQEFFERIWKKPVNPALLADAILPAVVSV